MYIRNAWYMAGWSQDVAANKLVPFSLLGEKLVLYRKIDGSIACLADRCSHRLAPLSLGSIEGDDVRCMYHGLKFSAQGHNVDVPMGGRPSPARNVRCYPVIERYGSIWVWPGVPDKASPDSIPDFVGIESPEWSMAPGRMDYEANYRLINDNLLDLTHVGFVHKNSFLDGREMSTKSVDGAPPIVEALPNGVRVTRLARSTGPLAMVKHRFETDLICDQVLAYDFLVPGIFLLRHAMYPEGALDRAKAQGLPDGVMNEKPLYDTLTCQAVTPTSATSTSYFFAYGPWAEAAADRPIFTRLGLMAFAEDRVMIEGQQKVINSAPNAKMMMLGFDMAAVLYNKMADKRIAEEEAAGSPATAQSHSACEAQCGSMPA